MKRIKKASEAIVSASVLMVIGVLVMNHRLELARRGEWMRGVNEFRERMEGFESRIELFKADVESRTADRWTKSQHTDRENEVWREFIKSNPSLRVPEALEVAVESVP